MEPFLILPERQLVFHANVDTKQREEHLVRLALLDSFLLLDQAVKHVLSGHIQDLQPLVVANFVPLDLNPMLNLLVVPLVYPVLIHPKELDIV